MNAQHGLQRALISTTPIVCGTKAKRPPRGVNLDKRIRPYRYGVTVAPESQHTGCISGSREWTRDRLVDDLMIRSFVRGTFLPYLDLKRETIVVKRKLNTIIVAMFITPRDEISRIYFLVGYAEKLMGAMFGCNVQLELRTGNY